MDGAGAVNEVLNVFAKEMRIAAGHICKLGAVAMNEAKLVGEAQLGDVVRDH